MGKSNLVSKKALKAAREAKELELAKHIVEEEFADQEARLARTQEVKERVARQLAHPNAEDPNYWTAPLGKKGVKKVRKALTSIALDSIKDGEVQWRTVPILETDAIDNIEGIQPSFFLALMLGDDQSFKDGLKLVQTLASNEGLVRQQGWNDGSQIAWYRVANAALLIAKEPKLLPALAAGWMPPEGTKDPSEWMKSLKSYAQAIAAAA